MSQNKSRRDQILDAAQKDLRRRRRERIFILIAALLVATLVYSAFHFSQVAERSSLIQPFVIYLFNFAVWALLLVLILILVFLIVRNVVKFYFERRKGVLGSRIRMRLIVAFMALTLGPAAVLFILSIFILNTSIEHLYEPHVLNVVETSKGAIQSANQISEMASKVLEAKYDADGEDAVHFGQELARALLERGWINVFVAENEIPSPGDGEGAATGSPEGSRAGPLAGSTASAKQPTPLDQLAAFIDFKRREYGLQTVAVFDASGKRLAYSAGQELSLPEFPGEDIEKALDGEQGYNPPISVEGGGAIIYAFYPVPRRASGDQTEIVGAITVGKYITWVPADELGRLAVASEATAMIEDYKTLRRMELPIKFSYFILLVFVTLVVIFLAVWFGFYMAKGITEPIQLLAEGTENVASGNLDYRIDIGTVGDDEIATLVRSFNRMTEDIQKSRFELGAAYESLHKSNLEIEQRRRYMETVLAHIGAGVFSLDTEYRLSTVNPAALRMLGKRSEEARPGTPLTELLRPEEIDVLKPLIDELEKSGLEEAQRQVTMVREKRSFVVLLTVSTLRDDRENNLGTVVVIDDLTELIRAHRAMAWREVARRIAHEIKNPLTPIKLSAERIERRYAEKLSGEDAEVFTECIRTIIRQVEELKHLVNEFYFFARLPSTNPVPSNLQDIIAEVIPIYREGRPDVSFRLIGDPSLPLIDLDREQMKRVFINLFDNALASMESGGDLATEIAYNRQIRVARIEVRDTGHGIPDQVKDRLFEPYYSTKVGGSGLGLTIVQRIISDHYGYIRVMDNEPQGTKIVIELPVVLAERQVGPKDAARTM